MPQTPSFGLRYPTLGDTPNVPRDLENLADDVDVMVQVGVATIPGGSPGPGSTVSVAVDFGRVYTVPPAVFVANEGNPGGSQYMVLKAASINTTGCTILAYNVHDTDPQTFPSFTVHWLAVKKG